MGFTFNDLDSKGIATPLAEMRRLIAEDPQNQEVIFPYIGGEEVNTSPTQAPHRYVINFGDMTEQDCRQRWPDLMAIVEEKVKPERVALPPKNSWNRDVASRWWQFGAQRAGLSAAIEGLDRVLVTSRVLLVSSRSCRRVLSSLNRWSSSLSVIMRYTLRLLTLDQLSRAAGLVCALELEREKEVARYGEWPFEIGLWVGKAATPNILGRRGDSRSDSARAKVRQFKADPRGKPSPIPLENCPWCGTRFLPESFTLLPNDDQPRELRIVCTNFECEFTRDRALPIVAVDEPIYRRLPAFLIATVDKFAALSWVGTSGALLGGAERHDASGFYGAAEPHGGTRLASPLPPHPTSSSRTNCT